MELAKLDFYDYVVLDRLFNNNHVIRIYVESNSDPSLVDILSDINRADGRIYVEDKYYLYMDNYRFIYDGNRHYMEIDVKEI